MIRVLDREIQGPPAHLRRYLNHEVPERRIVTSTADELRVVWEVCRPIKAIRLPHTQKEWDCPSMRSIKCWKRYRGVQYRRNFPSCRLVDSRGRAAMRVTSPEAVVVAAASGARLWDEDRWV